MHRKILAKLFQLSVLMMNIQFVFGPVAYANQQQQNGWSTAGNIISGATNILSQAANTYVQTRNGMNGGPGQIEMIEARLAPMLKIRPIDQSQVPPVFNGCLVLPANGADLTGGMSCEEANDQQVQAGYTEAIISIAEFNIKQLENYTTKGHERFTSQGKGCYEQKITDFEGMLKAREEELNKMQNSLKERIEAFKRASEQDLEEIRKSTALLTGQPKRFLENINLGDEFFGANDRGNACSSVLDETAIRRVASEGYNKIEETIFSSMNASGNGRKTPDQILTSAKQYRQDVKKLADVLSKRVKDNKDLSIDLGSTTFNTQLIGDDSKALQRVTTLFNKQNAEELKALEDKLDLDQAVAESKPAQKMLQDIQNNDIRLDERLRVYERDYKNSCVKKIISSNWGSPEAFAKEFRNPNVSRKLNKRADSAFASELAGWIQDDQTDIDQTLSHFQALESKGLNSSKVIVTGKSFTFNGKTISASTPLRISQFYRILADNCKAQYRHRRNSSGFSDRDIVEKLRTYGKKVDRKRKTAASKLKSLLKKELLRCPEDENTGVAANSCSDAMNMNSSSFCLRTAETCAGNFKGCHQKALKFRDNVFNKRDRLARTYRKKANRLKEQVKGDLLAINSFVEAQARSLDAQLRLGTVFQTNKLDFNLNDTFFYNNNGEIGEGIPRDLRMDDPEEMLKVADMQIEALKTQLAQQKAEQLAALNKMKDEYLANYDKQKQHWGEIIGQCKQRNGQFDKMVAEQNKNAAETDQKIKKACMELQAFNMSGSPCGGVEDLMSTVQEAMMMAPPSQNQQARGLASYYDRQNLSQLYKLKAQCGTTQDSNPIAQLPRDYDIFKNYCNKREYSKPGPLGLDKERVKLCRAAERDKKKGAKKPCTEKELNNHLTNTLKDKGKVVCEIDGLYEISSNVDGKKCGSQASSKDLQDVQKKREEVAENGEQLAKNLTEKTAAKDATKKKLEEAPENKTLTADQINEKLKETPEYKAYEQAQKDIDEHNSKIAEYDSQIKKLKEDSSSYDGKVVEVTKKNIDEILGSIDTSDDFFGDVQVGESCYFTDYLIAKQFESSQHIGAALEEAQDNFTAQTSGRQMGEHNIAMAMCNGNYEGAFDSHTIPGADTTQPTGYSSGVVSESSNHMITD